MDKTLYNKILAGMLSLFLVVGCVTYQPQQVDAFLGKVASFTAKKAAVWVAKESMENSVEKILKKKIDITDPLFNKYIGRVDYDMVHIDGKTFLMRNNLGAAEKTALKDQVGTVIDRMMYGNNAGWLSWLDWWSVGPMLLVGDIIFTEMTDDNYSFIDDVLKQAMIDLGFLTIPEDNFTDSVTKDPVKHYDTPPTTPTPDKTKNYSQVDTIQANDDLTTSVTLPIVASYTPMSIGTYVVEVVPNVSVSAMGRTSVSDAWTYARISDLKLMNFEIAGGNTFWNEHGSWEDKIDMYVNGVLKKTDIRSVDLQRDFPTAHLKKINRYIYSWDMPAKRSVMILESTVDSSIPSYKFVIKGEFKPKYPNANGVRFTTYPTLEMKSKGYKIYQDYFTDRIITPPSPRPAPQLKEVKADNPKDYVSSPVINKDPKTGKPTMAIPVTAIVQDPVQNPVKPDPNGGIIISKPDGTPVTDPETELPPVTNNPEVVTNPTTSEPEIKPTPNSPPQPATPPVNTPEPTPDPPTTEDPDTGDPDTGDPDTDSPPTDPDDEDPGKVRWDKLKDIPNFMTTRFPFSLPWDIARFLDAVFPDVTPISELVFEFPDIGSYDTSFEIRIPEYFEPWMDFARAAFIYGFDISLVYAIYRLFGGAE